MHQRCSLEYGISSDIWDRVPGTVADNTRNFHRVGLDSIVSGYLEECHECAALRRREVEIDGGSAALTYPGALLGSYLSTVLEIHIHAHVAIVVAGQSGGHLVRARGS